MNRDEILREMGLTVWRLRRPATVAVNAGAPSLATSGGAVESLSAAIAPATPAMPEPQPAVVAAPTVESSRAMAADDPGPAHRHPEPAEDDASQPPPGFFDELPLEVLAADPPRPVEEGASLAGFEPPEDSGAIGIGPERRSRIAGLDWDALGPAVGECNACGLCRQRKQAVFGVGDLRPDWLFIGEGPGEQEDLRGEPFVGAAGQLLDAMLAAIALRRGDKVYIANAVKCRPPGNRTPTPEEIATCRPFLMRQIALLRPKLIVLLGKAAVSSVLDLDSSLASLRGRVHRLGRIPVIVTYHPAYLLRTLPDKAKAWEDLCHARRTLREAETAGQ